ncbi:MAG TPA: Nif3-like dinuclear metal center hexameric protein [Gemmataceae bacterium]|nr:Nif3-like dinuclear metal center hexameric protein [Gemmataceae bacterium]
MCKLSTVASVVDYLDQWAPRHLAADWDNVGLLLGERSAAVERIMTCLTVTPESAAEAIAGRANLIVTHHPILFRGVKRLTDATSEGRMLLGLARAGVAVYSPHTAFDNTRGGINELLARRLALTDVVPLRRSGECGQMKVVVFVPDKDLNRVADAMFAAGAGQIGEYRECSFRLAGTGTFFGSDAANPTIGKKGRREEVNEWRLEAVCPANGVEAVVAAIRRSHSYEEPAFDIYPLHTPAARRGEGRLGLLPRSQPLGELAATVKTALQASAVQIIGDLQRPIQRVAIACGAGGELLSDAVRARADVLLSGEMRFHDYLHASAEGLALILPGHYASERCGIEELAERLRDQFPQLHIWASERETDPVQWV